LHPGPPGNILDFYKFSVFVIAFWLMNTQTPKRAAKNSRHNDFATSLDPTSNITPNAFG
jgi:hypothetical protein